jgi:hypothetical protein
MAVVFLTQKIEFDGSLHHDLRDAITARITLGVTAQAAIAARYRALDEAAEGVDEGS